MDHLLTASQNLAKNLLALRQKRSISQVQLSKWSGVPRTTITNMESGLGNPSLSTILKVAGSLNVTIEELLSDVRDEIEVYKKGSFPIVKNRRGVSVLKLLPGPIAGMEMDRIILEPGARMKGSPHLAKTKEYFFCDKGSVVIYVNKKPFNIEEGDLLAFPGDSNHAYVNKSSSKKASGFSVVVICQNYGK